MRSVQEGEYFLIQSVSLIQRWEAASGVATVGAMKRKGTSAGRSEKMRDLDREDANVETFFDGSSASRLLF